MKEIECIAVGDECVGKSCIFLSYINKIFPRELAPSVFEEYSIIALADGNPVRLKLLDIAGTEECNNMRKVSYKNKNIILICFSVIIPSSFKSVETKWFPEVNQNCPLVPILLVGTQSDLRKDKGTLEKLRLNKEKPIAIEKCVEMAKLIGAIKYLECSALTQTGLSEVFDEIAHGGVGKMPNSDHKSFLKCKIS